MTSWQRRMVAVDRRFSRQAAVTDGPITDPALPAEPAADPLPAEDLREAVTLVPRPGTAARLAELLRADQRAGHEGRQVQLAGTA
jgi:hypothetical protein